jgi:nucleotide-binding universal stress UspA family protein
MTALRTVLFATDFSEQSEAAYPLACALARDQKARLIVLYVDPPPLFHGEEVDRRASDDYYQRLHNELNRYQAPEGVVVEQRLEEGPPVDEVLRVAKEERCDLIVLATHGRSGLRRFLVGSFAEQVLRRAPCPVMTLSAPALRDAADHEQAAGQELASPAPDA